MFQSVQATFASKYLQQKWQELNRRVGQAIAAAGGKVFVNGADTTMGFLLAKLVAGTGITLTVQNPNADETIRIDSSGGGHGIIVNGVPMPQQPELYFKGVEGEDEPVDGWTIITFPRRVTTAQRIAISSFDGQIVFDTDLQRHLAFNVNAWETL